LLIEVYRYALRHHDAKVHQVMDSNYNRIMEEAASRWVSYLPTAKISVTAGVDSSWNKKAFQGLNLYAIDAIAITSSAQTLAAEYEVDLAESARNEFLESKAMAMEASVAKKAAESEMVDLVLVDGSIIPRLRGKSGAGVNGGTQASPTKYVFISKSSESRSQFGLMQSRAGDIYYYSHASKNNPGFSRPRKAVSADGTTVTEVYSRLRMNTPVIRIELLVNAREEQVMQTLDMISYHSVNGYPYCLRRAHNSCKISDDDMDRLASVFGMHHEPGARGVLNE